MARRRNLLLASVCWASLAVRISCRIPVSFNHPESGLVQFVSAKLVNQREIIKLRQARPTKASAATTELLIKPRIFCQILEERSIDRRVNDVGERRSGMLGNDDRTLKVHCHKFCGAAVGDIRHAGSSKVIRDPTAVETVENIELVCTCRPFRGVLDSLR